jgi:hypothetical protein
MQAEPNVLLVAQDPVAGMALEVVPDLLDRVEFGRVSGEALEMEPRKCIANRMDCWTFVNPAAIPEQDDMSPKVLEQQAQEWGHVYGLEVVLLEAGVQAHAGASGRHRERRNGRDPVVLIVVPDDGRMSPRAPSPATRRDQHETALIQEGDVGAKSSGFFL